MSKVTITVYFSSRNDEEVFFVFAEDSETKQTFFEDKDFGFEFDAMQFAEEKKTEIESTGKSVEIVKLGFE